MLVFYSKSIPASNPTFWPEYWTVHSSHVVEAHMPEFMALRKHVPAGSKVLDAGCGSGYVTRALNDRGYRAVGIDFDVPSVIWGYHKLGNFPAAGADVTCLPYADSFFDGVFLSSVAEHVPVGAEAAVRECARTLRSGGKMILTVPYMNVVRKIYAPFYRIREAWRARKGPRPFDQFVYTRSEVLQMLERNGFHVIDCKRSHYTTVLWRIPGMKRLHSRIFEPGTRPGPVSQNTAKAEAAQQSPAAGSRRNWKRVVKAILEPAMNALIANRLTVVAEKR